MLMKLFLSDNFGLNDATGITHNRMAHLQNNKNKIQILSRVAYRCIDKLSPRSIIMYQGVNSELMDLILIANNINNS